MYELAVSVNAKRSLRKLARSGKFNEERYIQVVTFLKRGEALPLSFGDHQLKGALSAYRECHLGFDLILVYEKDEKLKVVTVTKIGTHDEVFG